VVEIGGVEDDEEKENEELMVARGLFELLSRQPLARTHTHTPTHIQPPYFIQATTNITRFTAALRQLPTITSGML
jgi:hypothetical protein